MPRLFVGLSMPEDVREALVRLAQPMPGTRWTAPGDFHLTLRFAGDIDNGKAREFIRGLGEIDEDAFDLELSGLGTFGGSEPNALWIGAKLSPSLSALQRAVERKAREAGLPAESRKFTPHVTLARLSHPRIEALTRYLTRHATLGFPPFHIGAFSAFSARPHVGGGPYAVVERFPLRGGIDEEAMAFEMEH